MKRAVRFGIIVLAWACASAYRQLWPGNSDLLDWPLYARTIVMIVGFELYAKWKAKP